MITSASQSIKLCLGDIFSFPEVSKRDVYILYNEAQTFAEGEGTILLGV